MKTEYILIGRNNEKHVLRLANSTNDDFINDYVIETDYPIGISKRSESVMSIDFAGGPMLFIGDNFDDGVISKIWIDTDGKHMRIIKNEY